MAVPLSVSLTATFNLAMNFIAVFVFALINGITPEWSWFWLVPIVLGFMVLATGVGMVLSALYVRFRDVAPIWDVLSQILFYSSPIMYIATYYKGLEHVALLSPIALMLTQMGHAFVHPGLVHGAQEMRSAYAASGGALHMLASLAVIPLVFGLGWWFFTREAPRVAENL